MTMVPEEGKIVRIPGLPAMYDHEFFPQDVSVLAYQTT